MEIKKIKNYKDLANKFKEITKCDEVKISEMRGNNHYHFGMIKDGMPIATICYEDGELSVAPFIRVEDSNTNGNEWINVNKLPIFDDFVVLMEGLKELVVDPVI